MQQTRAEAIGAAGVGLLQAMMFAWAVFGSPPYAFYGVLKWSSLLAAVYVGWALFQRSRALAPASFVLLSLGLLHVTANMRKDEWPPYNAAGGFGFAIAFVILAIRRSSTSPSPASTLGGDVESEQESEQERKLRRSKERESLLQRSSVAATIVVLLVAGVASFLLPVTRAPSDVLSYAQVRGAALSASSEQANALVNLLGELLIYDEDYGESVFDTLETFKALQEREGPIVTEAGSRSITLESILARYSSEAPMGAMQRHGVSEDYRAVRDWISKLQSLSVKVRDSVPQSVRSQELDSILEARSALEQALSSKPPFSVPSASYDQHVERIASGEPGATRDDVFGWLETLAFALLPLAFLAIPPWPWLLLWMGADDQRFHFGNGLYWHGIPVDKQDRMMSGLWYCLRSIGCVVLWSVLGALLRHFLNRAATDDSVAYVGLPAAPFAVLALAVTWCGMDTFRYGLAPGPPGRDWTQDGPLMLVSALALVISFYVIAP